MAIADKAFTIFCLTSLFFLSTSSGDSVVGGTVVTFEMGVSCVTWDAFVVVEVGDCWGLLSKALATWPAVTAKPSNAPGDI